MSFVQDNKFLVALAGGTLLGMAGLYFLGSKGQKDYESAKEQYSAASAEAAQFEKIVPYPRSTNKEQKEKAINAYRDSIEALQKAFEKYQAPANAPLSPQDFAGRLKTVNDELAKRFAENQVKLPDAFFSGFAAYRSALPDDRSTAILAFELEAANAIFGELADAGISELKNVYREQLPEERRETWQPALGDVARSLPLEITFSGTEKSVRTFLSKIASTEQRFIVIRALQIENSKKGTPPLTSDAKFEQPAAPKNNSFSGFFDSQTAAPQGDAAAAPADENAQPTEPETPVDTSRILQQVLGSEELRVFVRLDVLQFLPAKKLP